MDLDNVAREGLRNILRSRELTITFTKTDGTQREMRCTLNENVIPTKQHAKNDKERANNPDVCPVWDVDSAEWRSFRWDSLTKIEV